MEFGESKGARRRAASRIERAIEPRRGSGPRVRTPANRCWENDWSLLTAVATGQLFEQLPEQMMAEQIAFSGGIWALPIGLDLEPPTLPSGCLGTPLGQGADAPLQPEVLAMMVKPLGPGRVPTTARTPALGQGVPFAIALRFRMLSQRSQPLTGLPVAVARFYAQHPSTGATFALGQTQVKVQRSGAEHRLDSPTLRLQNPGLYRLQAVVGWVGSSCGTGTPGPVAQETRLLEIV